MVGPALAVILDRPGLVSLKGGQDLDDVKKRWDYKHLEAAIDQLKHYEEQRLGYEYETIQVGFSGGDSRSFRIRRGQRGRGLHAIGQVLTDQELDEAYAVYFGQGDESDFVDLASDAKYWQ